MWFKVLLLDELVVGMNCEEIGDMVCFILDVQEKYGMIILLVEYDMYMVMDICLWIVVLNFGQQIVVGIFLEIVFYFDVIEVYFGSLEVV